MPVKYRPGEFDIDKKTPTRKVRQLLERARTMGGIYLIARLIEILKDRGEEIDLYQSEKRKLLNAIEQARTSKQLPLKEWLPRGYQIARLLCTAKAVIPDFKPDVTERDKKLMLDALEQFRKEKDIWDKDQIPSLIYSAKKIGVILV